MLSSNKDEAVILVIDNQTTEYFQGNLRLCRQ